MARRVLDRKKLRAEAAAVESSTALESVKQKKTSKTAKAPAAPKVKKPRAKKVKVLPRMRVRWCIYDGSMKSVALFEYNQLPAAKTRLAELLEKKPSYFLQLFKDELPVTEEEVAVS